MDKVINKVNVITGDGSSEEFYEAAMVAPADKSESITKLRQVHVTAEFALKNDDVKIAEGTTEG